MSFAPGYDGRYGSTMFHLELEYHGVIFPERFAEFEEELKGHIGFRRGMVTKEHHLTPESIAEEAKAIIWVLIAMKFYKSFFDEIFKQAGSDTYAYFKKSLNKLRRGTSDFRNEKIRPPEHIVAVENGLYNPDYSIVFSLDVELEASGRRVVRFLVRNGCSDEEFEEGVDQFMEMMASYFSGVPGRDLRINLEDDQEGWVDGTLFVSYDRDKSLHVVDPLLRHRVGPCGLVPL